MANWTSATIHAQDDRPITITHQTDGHPALRIVVGEGQFDDLSLIVSFGWGVDQAAIVEQLRTAADSIEQSMTAAVGSK